MKVKQTAWMRHVKKVQMAHKKMPLSKVLKLASKTYK